MGYCFQLQIYDVSGNFVENYEYAGSYGAETVLGFLRELRDLCYECWSPLTEDVLWFLDDLQYDIVECSEILESFNALKIATDEGTVKWSNEDRHKMFKDFHKTFRKVVKLGGHIKQTLHD